MANVLGLLNDLRGRIKAPDQTPSRTWFTAISEDLGRFAHPAEHHSKLGGRSDSRLKPPLRQTPLARETLKHVNAACDKLLNDRDREGALKRIDLAIAAWQGDQKPDGKED